jgi:L-arabinonolactonase
LIAFEEQFAFFDPVSHELEVAVVAVPGGGMWEQTRLRGEGYRVRLNDGRVDRSGNLVIGGINESWGDFKEGWKAVQPCYRVEMVPNTTVTTLSVSVLQHIPLAKVSNSICFSLDGSTMYHTDTSTKAISMFSYQGEGGGGGGVVIRTDNQPDGSVVDAR